MSEDIFFLNAPQVGLESGGWRPEMLLNFLQCTGHPYSKDSSSPKYQSCVLGLTTDFLETFIGFHLIPKEVLTLKHGIQSTSHQTLASLCGSPPTISFYAHPALVRLGDSVLPKHNLCFTSYLGILLALSHRAVISLYSGPLNTLYLFSIWHMIGSDVCKYSNK